MVVLTTVNGGMHYFLCGENDRWQTGLDSAQSSVAKAGIQSPFCGTPDSGTKTPGLRLRLYDMLCDILIVYLRLT